MDLMHLPPPVFTALDGITQGIAAAVYLLVAAAAWLRAPRDIRTQVFLAFGIANAIVFGVPTGAWLRGVTDPTALPRAANAAGLSALAVGALLLFHFTQVFPWRRPWIRNRGIYMAAGYIVAAAIASGVALFMPLTIDEVTVPSLLVVLLGGVPLLLLIAFVSVAGIVSLLRSYREVRQNGPARMKRPIEWILISQAAGGTLAIAFAPVLIVIAPGAGVRAALTLAIWAVSLLTPLAFGAAVWKYDLLSIAIDAT